MLIAIASIRKPKVDAVKKSFENSPYFQWKILEYLVQSSDSNVSDMPLNIEEIMLWAKNRVKNLRKSISMQITMCDWSDEQVKYETNIFYLE